GPQVGNVRSPTLIGTRRREVTPNEISGHWQSMFGVGRRSPAPLVACTNTMLAHQALDTPLAHPITASPQLPIHAWGPIGAPILLVDRSDQTQQLLIAQPLSSRLPTGSPCLEAALTHPQRLAQQAHRPQPRLTLNPGVLHSVSLAKYAVAFFKISFSIFSRAFSARRRESSICSSVTFFAFSLSRPRSASFSQLRSVCSCSPSCSATSGTERPLLTMATAWSLNSAVYSRFKIRFISTSNDSPSYNAIVGSRNWRGSSRFQHAVPDAGRSLWSHR